MTQPHRIAIGSAAVAAAISSTACCARATKELFSSKSAGGYPQTPAPERAPVRLLPHRAPREGENLRSVAGEISNCWVDLGQCDVHINSVTTSAPRPQLSASSADHNAEGAHQNLEIEKEAPVLDVGHVE